MDSRLTRRSFLLGTAAALGAAACAKSKGPISVAPPAPAQLNLLVTSGAGDGPNQQAISVFEAGVDQRVAFVLTGKSGFLAPAPGSATLQFSTDQKNWGPSVAPTVHSDTGASASTYLTSTYRFPTAGQYWLRATYQGQTAESPVIVIEPATAMVPRPGQKMISVATPTTGDKRGVDPICTRSPQCPFHTQSLDTALGGHLPVVLMFATPALCQTATCGPVLDTVVAAAQGYQSKINFVHSEIYTALSQTAPNTAAVAAYHLQSEPIMFLADANGMIVDRIDGLFGKAELTAALSRLAGA